MRRTFEIAFSFIFFLCCIENVSLACSEGMLRALKDEGLNPKQIEFICIRAKIYDETTAAPSEDQIQADLESLFKTAVKHKLVNVSMTLVPFAQVCDVSNIQKTKGIRTGAGLAVEITGLITLKMQAYKSQGELTIATPIVPDNAPIVQPGAKLPLKGTLLYEKTEKGWRLSKYEMTVDNGLQLLSSERAL
jgi:hypothetical protein